MVNYVPEHITAFVPGHGMRKEGQTYFFVLLIIFNCLPEHITALVPGHGMRKEGQK